MALPEYERSVFANSPLRLVVGQVRFPILLRFGDGTFIAPFHEAIRSEYPQVVRETQVSLTLSAKGLQSGPPENVLRFRSRDSTLSVIVSETAITLEALRGSDEQRFGYVTVDAFLARFGRILTAAQDTLGVTERGRLGLRYVNELRYPDANTLEDWGHLLNPDFLGFPATALLGGRVEHAFQEAQVQRTDGTFAIRHGLFTGNVVDSAPSEASASGRFYLIDLDYFDPTECALDVPATLNQMRGFNDTIYRFFRWTLGPILYHHLEVSGDA